MQDNNFSLEGWVLQKVSQEGSAASSSAQRKSS
jgi:hypothetical protein